MQFGPILCILSLNDTALAASASTAVFEKMKQQQLLTHSASLALGPNRQVFWKASHAESPHVFPETSHSRLTALQVLYR